MADLQLMILLFFTIKLCLTASRCLNFEIRDETQSDEAKPSGTSTVPDQQTLFKTSNAGAAPKSSRALSKLIKTKASLKRQQLLEEKVGADLGGNSKNRYLKQGSSASKEPNSASLDHLVQTVEFLMRLGLFTANLAAITFAMIVLEV